MELFDEKPSPVTPAKDAVRKVLTVTELNRRVKGMLEQNVGSVWVSGEISNLRLYDSGHRYFTLKDKDCQVRAVLFAGTAVRIKFELKDGMEVILHGRVTLYENSGQYQIIASSMEPKGVGALQLAFEQLKEKLYKEGLFDESRKRPLPFLPHTVGVVTSPSGAAVRDILNGINMRFPETRVLIYPSRVQGEGSAEEIAQGIKYLNTLEDVEVIIIGRGGGSIEDLWSFNEEIVVRAVHASEVPVVSAVGHEIDITISDLVADARAQTPTKAAELVVPLRQELFDHLDDYRVEMQALLKEKLQDHKVGLKQLEKRLALKSPMEIIRQFQQRLDDRGERMKLAVNNILKSGKSSLSALAGRMEAINPLKILARGYSVTTKDDKILTSSGQVKAGDKIKTRLSDGEIVSEVT
ncbi:MAG: exodeoxyribonuclease VII large subunit [Planctomycetes bacterium]|nr:exodeoxyribonuclease VII large subunit [Planctomycetota bacterium]